MSRYRKIEVKTWADAKFRRLSPIQPSGQALWLYMMTGTHTGPIPGLFRAGRAGMAEELGWEIEAFDEAFREVSDEGMVKADFKERLMWLPNALKHNKPESPNVVRSWRVELDMLPECDLKAEAVASMRQFIESLGAPYVAAFDEIMQGKEASGKPSRKASAKPSPNTMPNQEQEQEQEQEKEKSPHNPPRGAVGIKRFLEECKAKGELAIPEDDPVFTYADSIGVPVEFLRLAWREFVDRNKESGKKYTDWRKTFRNCVRGNWYKLWYTGADGKVALTSQGLAATKAHSGNEGEQP